MLLLLFGCATPRVISEDYESIDKYGYGGMTAQEEDLSSLFASDAAILAGDSIEKILNAHITLPKNARLAIIRFSRSRYTWWSEEFSEMDQTLQTGFVEHLRKCPRLSDVSFLPSLMTPEKKTIPYLREAAARYQADLLLVYRSANRFYTRSKIFRSDEAKANCIVEAILIDVRSGIVSFTSVSSKQYTVTKSKEDYDFSETIAKAEINAVSKALKDIGDNLLKFLEKAP
jgi:hypothetical protein